jgi:serine/threonine protein kinase
VKLAVHKETGEKWAMKIIDKKKYAQNAGKRKDSLMDEVKILQSLNHPNIIGIKEIFEDDHTLYIVLELYALSCIHSSCSKQHR